MTQPPFRYRAFLSYSHADEAAATKLHRGLEGYVLPRRVRKAHALPRRLIPIFRDVDELAASSGLTTRLQDALDQSQWLIVLCSPAAAASKYVNAEIDYFLQKHGPDRILCALAAGEPAECFPPALRALNEEPLAADFRPGKDFELSKLKLIAALAGVGFTELRSREAQRRKRQQLVAAALVAGVGLGGLAYWDLFHREHVDYYVSYVRRDGIWTGIDRVSPQAAAGRLATYRFTRAGRLNPPERVDYVNGRGGCAGHGMENILGERRMFDPVLPTARHCAIAFDYARDGSPARETLLNGVGQPKETLAYTAPDLAQFAQQGFAMSSEASGINYVQFTRDAAGFDTAAHFLYSRGVPRANRSHEYGLQFERDAAGRLIRREALDDQGKGTGEVTRLVYAPSGDLHEIRFEDATGRPRPGDKGYTTQRFERDAAGNVVRDSFLGDNGEPIVSTDGYAVRTLAYDGNGNPLTVCFLGARGEPAQSDHSGAACYHFRYDDLGRVTWEAGYDMAGKLTRENQDSDATEYLYDERGNVRELRKVAESGKLMEGRYGYALSRYTHDERGNNVTEAFFQADGKPALTPWGAEMRFQYDARDNVLEFLFLDTAGKPFLRPDTGFACYRIKRDERGNTVEGLSLDADLQPVIGARHGRAYRTNVYDEAGNAIEERSLDTQRRLMRDLHGVAIYRRDYDRLGRRVREVYFDESDRSIRHKEGYFGYRDAFDHRGRTTSRMFLDARGAPMTVARIGAAGVQYDHDNFGRLREETYLDAQGRPLSTGSVLRVEYVRDKYGEELERRFHGPAGRLAASPATGCAIQTRELDAMRRLVREQCLDVAGKPRNRLDERWATKTTAWKRGEKQGDQYFDATGRPVKVAKQ